MPNVQLPSAGPPPRDLFSALVIAIGAVVSVAMMSHHPSVHAHETRSFFAEAINAALLAQIVHGGLIATIVVMACGFIGFAGSLGLRRPAVRLALVAHVFGALALAGAALVNGLVFPALAKRFADGSEAEMEMARVVLAWNWEINQALAVVGVLAWSVAVCAWSAVLLPLRGAWRWIGAYGLLVGAVFAGLFLAGVLQFDVAGFGVYLYAQSGWNLAVGIRLGMGPR